MAVSQNGYPANDRTQVSRRLVPGTGWSATVRNGPAGDLLLSFARDFDAEVEDIDGPILDDWAYAERPIRGGIELSNHASGTAIDLNATRHPLGTRPEDNFTPGQIAVIRQLLVKYQGCIRWGGDYTGRKDPMHFEVIASETECREVLLWRLPGPLGQEKDDDMITVSSGTDEHVNLIVKGKTQLYVACSWGRKVQIHDLLFYGDTGPNLLGTGVGGATALAIDPNRPGPLAIPSGASMATMRYTAGHSFAVGLR